MTPIREKISRLRAARAEATTVLPKRLTESTSTSLVPTKKKSSVTALAVVTPSYPTPTKHEQKLLDKMGAVRAYVGTRVFERDRETEGICVAILSGTSCLFVGAPGAGKTFHTRLISKLFGLSVFDTLVSETTKPDSIFGPTDVPALAKGVQRTKVAGYAPDSQILFFDEIFKASGVVLNPLLWLINEHEYRNGDEGIIKCPTRAVFAASNELPTEEGLAPVYDRFLLRYHVGYLRNRASLNGMLAAEDDSDNAPTMTSDEIDELRRMTKRVVVPDDVRDLVYTLRDMLVRSVEISISDRRLVQSFKILRATALLNGRMYVTKDDIHILSYVFWERLEQVTRVRSVVLSVCNAKLSDLIAYEEIADEVWQTTLKSGDLTTLLTKLDDMIENASRFTTQEGKRIVSLLQDYRQRALQLMDQRAEFTVLIMQGADDNTWFQVGRGTEGLWSAQQMRSVKFRHFRKSNYWWQDAWTKKDSIIARKQAKRKLRKAIEETLKVKVVFTKM